MQPPSPGVHRSSPRPSRDHGFGRFGQMIARTLRMKKIPFTALAASRAGGLQAARQPITSATPRG
jgi:hypothetical protein